MALVRTAILISGRGSNMAALIRASHAQNYPTDIALVVSDNPQAAGLTTALEAGIATHVSERSTFDTKAAFEADVDTALRSANIDLVCLAGFMRVLSANFVAGWSGKILNIHPSLLPSFRGLDTHQRALDTGVRISGCTVHFVSAELDAGPIVAQAAVPVLPDDDADRLAARILRAEHRLYPQALAWVASGRVRMEDQAIFIDPSLPFNRDQSFVVPNV